MVDNMTREPKQLLILKKNGHNLDESVDVVKAVVQNWLTSQLTRHTVDLYRPIAVI